MRNVAAGVAYFACVFGAGFLLATIRVPLLVPRLGVRAAELLEMPPMLAVIALSARFVVVRFRLALATAPLLVTGALALALLLAAELGLAWALEGASVRAYIAGKDPVAGAAYALSLLLFAVMPALVGWRRRRRQPADA